MAPQKLETTLRAFASLSYREREILVMRFGSEPKTYAEIGTIHNVSPERIRQIEKQSLKVLQHRIERG